MSSAGSLSKTIQHGWAIFGVFATGLSVLLGVGQLVALTPARELTWSLFGFFMSLSVTAMGVNLYILLTTSRVKTCLREGQVERELVRLLRGSRQSLYYCGGAGLITDNKHWRKELQ